MCDEWLPFEFIFYECQCKHGVKRSRNNTPASAPPPSNFTSWPFTWTQWSQNRNIQQLHFLYGLSLCFSVLLTTLSLSVSFIFFVVVLLFCFMSCQPQQDVYTLAHCCSSPLLCFLSLFQLLLCCLFLFFSLCLSGQTISSKPYPWHSSTHTDKELCRFL